MSGSRGVCRCGAGHLPAPILRSGRSGGAVTLASLSTHLARFDHAGKERQLILYPNSSPESSKLKFISRAGPSSAVMHEEKEPARYGKDTGGSCRGSNHPTHQAQAEYRRNHAVLWIKVHIQSITRNARHSRSCRRR